jgi:4-carboxymuconolactone decarboxylase
MQAWTKALGERCTFRHGEPTMVKPAATLTRSSALLLALLTIPAHAAAQDRLPPIPADKMTDAQKQAAAEFKVHRGVDINGPFIPLLRSPEVMLRTTAMGDYLRYKTALGSPLNEFVILITARHLSQSHEWSVHQPIALKAGVGAEIVKAVAEGRKPTGMSADQDLVYDFCTELLHNQSVSDATYARAIARFGEQGTIEMIAVVGYYNFLGFVLNVARTPPIAPGSPTLVPLVH